MLTLTIIIGGVFLSYKKLAGKKYFNPYEEGKVSQENKEKSCEDFKNLVKKAECYTDLAIKLRNEGYCEKIIEDLRGNCYFKLAMTTKDETYCGKFKFATVGHNDRCYVELAFLKNDVSICDRVELPFWRTTCKKRLEEKRAEIAHWNTFRNEKYKYEIKFPGNYAVKIENLDLVRIYYPYASRSPTLVGYPRGVVLKIKVYNNPEKLPLAQWLTSLPKVEVIKRILVSGIDSIEAWHSCNMECMGATDWISGSDCVKGVFIPKDDKIYNIDLEGETGWNFDEENPKNICYFGEESIFTKILSTFHFID